MTTSWQYKASSESWHAIRWAVVVTCINDVTEGGCVVFKHWQFCRHRYSFPLSTHWLIAHLPALNISKCTFQVFHTFCYIYSTLDWTISWCSKDNIFWFINNGSITMVSFGDKTVTNKSKFRVPPPGIKTITFPLVRWNL